MARKKLPQGQKHTLKVGDAVRIGNGKIDWDVIDIESGDYVDAGVELRSPMSGRTMIKAMDDEIVLVHQAAP